jgi:Tol biopolymer transport system component
MSESPLFDVRLRAALRGALDSEPLPHPSWSDAPAARRIAAQPRRRRWPLRTLVLAAVLAAGGAVGVGALVRRSEPPPPIAPVANGWIAYTSWNGADYDVVVTRPGAAPRKAVGSDGDGRWETCPVFSPDGRSLAYAEASDDSSDTPEWTLVIAGIDATGRPTKAPARIPMHESASCAAWSPTGTQIAYSATSGLHVVDLATRTDVLFAGLGTTAEAARPGDEVIGSEFAWSPDGGSFAFTKDDPLEGHPSELWTVASGRSATRLSPGIENESIESIAWSPDGREIAMRIGVLTGAADARTIGGWSIRSLDVASPVEARQIDTWRDDGLWSTDGPVWSPDGGRLAYLRDGTVVVRERQGERRTLDIDGIGITTACISGWSPDGDRLLVVVGDADVIDRGTNLRLVGLDPDGSDEPDLLSAWGATSTWACSAAWQAVHP